MTQPLNYSPEPPPRGPRRVTKWLTLLAVWAVGLCIWGMYIAILFVGFLKVFS
jgi:hypothetical protein